MCQNSKVVFPFLSSKMDKKYHFFGDEANKSLSSFEDSIVVGTLYIWYMFLSWICSNSHYIIRMWQKPDKRQFVVYKYTYLRLYNLICLITETKSMFFCCWYICFYKMANEIDLNCHAFNHFIRKYFNGNDMK